MQMKRRKKNLKIKKSKKTLIQENSDGDDMFFKFEANNFNEINNFLEKLKLKKNDSKNLKYNLRNSENLIEPASKTTDE
ncbi:hypothetical protein BpHYR1_045064 [Brachionus plicatilis]|uniref:Uncharacterized protein n=1 Tax=Brachionus plicatilis TaxID=10195 RepID=A0A3M7SL60_BRAPC|nr:hypothetical protein BpHYR1_045064 [Brachionus plicatilis]